VKINGVFRQALLKVAEQIPTALLVAAGMGFGIWVFVGHMKESEQFRNEVLRAVQGSIAAIEKSLNNQAMTIERNTQTFIRMSETIDRSIKATDATLEEIRRIRG